MGSSSSESSTMTSSPSRCVAVAGQEEATAAQQAGSTPRRGRLGPDHQGEDPGPGMRRFAPRRHVVSLRSGPIVGHQQVLGHQPGVERMRGEARAPRAARARGRRAPRDRSRAPCACAAAAKSAWWRTRAPAAHAHEVVDPGLHPVDGALERRAVDALGERERIGARRARELGQDARRSWASSGCGELAREQRRAAGARRAPLRGSATPFGLRARRAPRRARGIGSASMRQRLRMVASRRAGWSLTSTISVRGRRLLERLQQRVGGRRMQRLGGMDQQHAEARAMRGERDEVGLRRGSGRS